MKGAQLTPTQFLAAGAALQELRELANARMDLNARAVALIAACDGYCLPLPPSCQSVDALTAVSSLLDGINELAEFISKSEPVPAELKAAA